MKHAKLPELKTTGQTGFSLLEILIALLLGLIVVGGALSVYISTVKGSSDTVKSARLSHDLDSAMQIMINDIRRAGFWGGAIAVSGSNVNPNPFTQGNANIQIPAIGCILYSYDANINGTVDANEYYGFKWEGTNIRMRRSAAASTAADCAANTAGWNTMNLDDQAGNGSFAVIVDALSFNFNDPNAPSRCLDVTTNNEQDSSCATTTLTLNSGDSVIETRQVSITLTAHVENDPTVTQTLNSTVKVRNNRIFIQP